MQRLSGMGKNDYATIMEGVDHHTILYVSRGLAMRQIVVEDLVKTFHVAVRQAGLLGAFMGLMKRQYRAVTALAGISFAIEPGELVGILAPMALASPPPSKFSPAFLCLPLDGALSTALSPGWSANGTWRASAWCSGNARSSGGTCR